MSDPTKSKALLIYARITVGVFLVLGLGGFVGLFSSFLTSTFWYEVAHVPALIAAALVGINMFCVFMVARPSVNIDVGHVSEAQREQIRENEKIRKNNPVYFLLSMIFAGVCISWMTYVSVMTTIPVLSTWVKRYDVSVVVKVSEPENFRSNNVCRRYIEIQGKYGRRLCGVPHEFRKSLTDGDEVVVFGSGNRLGLFYESFGRP